MATLTYRQPDGDMRIVEVGPGTSVMQAALANGVPGIVAECGGQLMCATCHVYVDEVDGSMPDQTEDEHDMLELAAAPVGATSRLSCQLVVDDGLRSACVTIPERQI